jgi:hypothetical protein
MPESRKSQPERGTKRNPRDPGPDREQSTRPPDERTESDGTVESELDELDTDKYQAPRKR